jgi:endonuclease YncB( thermonuclease family)
MGLLTISGVLRAKQFWPGGRSDADTATVDLAAKQPFVFVDDAGKRHPTSVFDNAEVIGQHGRNTVVKQSRGSTVRKVTIRFQGVDAPELHYQPQVPGSGGKGVNHPFRQALGETCANTLHAIVASFGQAEIPCEVVTAVTRPSDVCDVFGRVVGNIVLKIGGARIDINQRLLHEGWVLPGLYNSMSKAEIQAVLADYKAAKQAKRGLFSKDIVTSVLAPFDPKQVEQKGPASFNPFSDLGPVNFPKFFRREAERYVRGAIGQNVGADLRQFIATKPTDLALQTDLFLKLKGSTIGKKPRPEFKQLATFLAGNHYPIGPEIVFWENESTLVRAGTNTEIKTW